MSPSQCTLPAEGTLGSPLDPQAQSQLQDLTLAPAAHLCPTVQLYALLADGLKEPSYEAHYTHEHSGPAYHN